MKDSQECGIFSRPRMAIYYTLGYSVNILQVYFHPTWNLSSSHLRRSLPWSSATSILKRNTQGRSVSLSPPPNQVNPSSKEAEHPHYLPFPVLDQHPRPMIWREVGMGGMVAAPWLRCQTPMALIKVQLFFLNKVSQFLYAFGHFLESCNSSPFYRCFCGEKSALLFTTTPWRFTVYF